MFRKASDMQPYSEFTVNRNGDVTDDLVAEEAPVAFEYNGISHAVMLASPADLEDFAFGFTLSEGIVESAAQIYDIDVNESAQGVVLKIEIASECFSQLKHRRRRLMGKTGCGLCGIESLDQLATNHVPLPIRQTWPINACWRGVGFLGGGQKIRKLTGATHAASCVSRCGKIAFLREDVGRQNALAKTLGAFARQAGSTENWALLITSRASYEMVSKAAKLGFTELAAVSAPTAAAIRLADSVNMHLYGFIRPGKYVQYSQASTSSESRSNFLT